MDNTMMEFPLTVPQLLDRANTLFPSVEVVSRLADHSLHRCSWDDIHRRARAVAEALIAAGLQQGDRVATLMWNHHAHMETYYGILGAGGVLHTLNLRLHPDDLAYIASHGGDRFIVVDDVLLPLFEQFKDRVGFERVIVVCLTEEPLTAGYDDYEEFIGQPSGDFTWVELDERQAAVMCYTSGTTGRPKGVVYSHRSQVIHIMCLCMADSFGISHNDSTLPIVPMFHANAWNIPHAAALAGAKLVLPGPHLASENLLDLLAGERVTMSAGVPTIWIGIVEAMRAEPGRWGLMPGMRVLTGGAAVPESLVRALDGFGLHTIHGWGMTETSAGCALSHVKRHLAKDANEDELFRLRAERTLPLPFASIRAENENGIAPWDGETMGELQVRSPWTAAAYYDRPDAAANWTGDGWLRTGDVVNIDPEGYLKICDRTKDLVKSGGEWISSQDLENALMNHPDVLEAAVIAVPHPKWQERPLAAVVPREGAAPTPEALRAHLAGQFTKWWLPDAIVIVEEIPKTSTGKFQKTILRERFEGWQWED